MPLSDDRTRGHPLEGSPWVASLTRLHTGGIQRVRAHTNATLLGGTSGRVGTLIARLLKFKCSEGDYLDVCKYLGISNPGITGEPRSLHPGREPVPASFGGAGG